MDNQIELFIEILITILFGAILGLETETREIETHGKAYATKKERERIGGVRTYAIISLFGGIAGLFYTLQQYILVYILFITVVALILSAYVLNVQIKHAFGLTTEIAVVIGFILGFLTTSHLLPLWLILVILVLLAFFLSQKRGIGLLINKIEHKEVIDVVKFALVAVVVLPILPNTNILLGDLLRILNFSIDNSAIKEFVLINPFNVWFIVVLISGINLFGYFLTRIAGSKRGLIITAAISGFISSTSATLAFAERSKTKENNDNYSSSALAGAALIANSFSFFTIAILMLVNYRVFFVNAIMSFVIMFFAGLAIGFIYLYRSKEKGKHKFEIKYEPFSIVPAIKFVAIIVAVTLVIQILQLLKVNNIFVIGITALSGITGMDASTIAFSNLAKDSVITMQIAVIALILANAINFLAKIVYGIIGGSRIFNRKLAFGLIVTAIIGLLGLFFVTP